MLLLLSLSLHALREPPQLFIPNLAATGGSPPCSLCGSVVIAKGVVAAVAVIFKATNSKSSLRRAWNLDQCHGDADCFVDDSLRAAWVCQATYDLAQCHGPIKRRCADPVAIDQLRHFYRRVAHVTEFTGQMDSTPGPGPVPAPEWQWFFRACMLGSMHRGVSLSRHRRNKKSNFQTLATCFIVHRKTSSVQDRVGMAKTMCSYGSHKPCRLIS